MPVRAAANGSLSPASATRVSEAPGWRKPAKQITIARALYVTFPRIAQVESSRTGARDRFPDSRVFVSNGSLRFCARSSAGPEANFEQNDPHPDPLPSDGRGNRRTRLSYLPKLFSHESLASQQRRLIAFRNAQIQFLVTQLCRYAALRGTIQIPLHDEIRLIYFFDRVRLFAYCHRQRIEAHWPAAKLHNDRIQNALVHFVETVLVDLQHRERLVGHRDRDATIASHLRIVAHATEQIVRNAWCAATAPGDFVRAIQFDFHVQQPRGANDDFVQLRGLVIVQPLAHGETGEQRRGEQAAAGRGADEGETRQVQADAARVGSLVNDDVEFEILHRRVEIFLDGLLQAMDFIDE